MEGCGTSLGGVWALCRRGDLERDEDLERDLGSLEVERYLPCLLALDPDLDLLRDLDRSALERFGISPPSDILCFYCKQIK